jgi:hypothetical protein
MARTDYDYNIHSSEPSSLMLTAYQQYLDADDTEWVRIDTSKYHSIKFDFPQNLKEIEYLIGGDLYVNNYPLTDYDDWVDNVFQFAEDAPPLIKNFIENLPPYELTNK